jgi:hypothetical protein
LATETKEKQTPQQKAVADLAILNFAGLVASAYDDTQDPRLKAISDKIFSYVKDDVIRQLLIDRVQTADRDSREEERNNIQNQWNEMFRNAAAKRMERGSSGHEELLDIIKQVKGLLDNGTERTGDSEQPSPEAGEAGTVAVESDTVVSASSPDPV